jgi:hypothetical protein
MPFVQNFTSHPSHPDGCTVLTVVLYLTQEISPLLILLVVPHGAVGFP